MGRGATTVNVIQNPRKTDTICPYTKKESNNQNFDKKSIQVKTNSVNMSKEEVLSDSFRSILFLFSTLYTIPFSILCSFPFSTPSLYRGMPFYFSFILPFIFFLLLLLYLSFLSWLSFRLFSSGCFSLIFLRQSLYRYFWNSISLFLLLALNSFIQSFQILSLNPSSFRFLSGFPSIRLPRPLQFLFNPPPSPIPTVQYCLPASPQPFFLQFPSSTSSLNLSPVNLCIPIFYLCWPSVLMLEAPNSLILFVFSSSSLRLFLILQLQLYLLPLASRHLPYISLPTASMYQPFDSFHVQYQPPTASMYQPPDSFHVSASRQLPCISLPTASMY